MTGERAKKPERKTSLLSRFELEQDSQQFQHEVEQLYALQRIGKQITSVSELEQVLTLVTKEAIIISKAEAGALMLLDRYTNELNLRVEQGIGDELPQNRRVKVKNSVVEAVVKTGKPLRRSGEGVKIWTDYMVRSLLYIPMHIRGEVIGVLYVGNQNSERSFTETDEEALTILADYAAIAIQNTRLSKAVRTISDVIGSGLEIRDVTGKILDELKEIVGYRRASIQLIGDDTRTLVTCRGFPSESIDEWLLRPISKDRLVSSIVASRRPLILEETSTHPDWDVDPLPDVKSWIGLPLINKGQVIGLLTLDHDKPGYYTNALEDILVLFGGQAAIAIENARLFEEAQRSSRDWKTISDIGNQIIKTEDLGDTLREIVSGAIELVRASTGVIHLVTDEGKYFTSFHPPGDAHALPRMQDPEGLTRKVISTGEMVIIPDIRIPSAYVNPVLLEHYRSMIAVPLKLESKVIGVLFLNFRETHFFMETEISLLSTLTTQAAITIKKIQLLNAEREQRALSEALIDGSPVATIALDESNRITRFNETCQRMTGYRAEEILGQSFATLFFDGEREAVRVHKIFEHSDKKKVPVDDLQTTLVGKRGELIWSRFAMTTVHNYSGERVARVILITDLREITIKDHTYQGQQDFLARLEQLPQDTPIDNLHDLQRRLTTLLKMTHEFCGTKYMILFASVSQDETVLHAVAWEGLPQGVAEQLPHFNWKKARLQQYRTENGKESVLRQEIELIKKWWPDREWRDRIVSGIRGEGAGYFDTLACGIPVRLADNYRGVLVFGPFEDTPDLGQMVLFLRNVGQTIVINALSWLQTLYLRAQRNESQRSTELIAHRAKTSLSPIIGKFGLIKRSVEENTDVWQAAADGERLVTNLSRTIARGLTSQFAEMELQDFQFQAHSLAALVQNCVESFREKADSEKRELRIDDTIELLPYAAIDSALLSVALGNLIDNALKYSFTGTYILVFSHYDTRQATIIIQDLGEQLPEDARRNLIEPGKRWGMSPRARRIPGTGFGLWDASVIVTAHGGKLDFSSVKYDRPYPKDAHVVKVWVTLPLGLSGAD